MIDHILSYRNLDYGKYKLRIREIGADEYKESVIESQYIKPFLSDGTLSDSISTDCVFFSIKYLDRSLDYEGTLEPINNINSVLIPFTINGYK